MTLAIPEELHKKMKAHPEIKWTEVARQAIEKRTKLIEEERLAWMKFAQKHAIETGWSEADELIKY